MWIVTTMRAALIDKFGDNDRVRVAEVPRPTPRRNDLLVEVKAASVNPVDFKIRSGKLKPLIPYRLPLVLGNDLSGVVVEVGPDVKEFKVGDEIFARLDKDRIGAFAELALVREPAAAKKPARLSHVEAASLPLVGLTSWQCLLDIGHLKSGQRVLVTAGSGGVGTFAIQLAKHIGAEVFTTVGARNIELVKKLGADHAIDYETTRFEHVAKDIDVVFDTQGGETLLGAFKVIVRGGVVVTIGGNPDAKFARSWGVNPVLVLALGFMARHITRAAKGAGAHFEYWFVRADGQQLARIADLAESNVIRPIIDRTFALAQVKEALAYSEAGRATGKVIVEV
jgi:NADPH:quinone reductase-like Zn-dependent oxidoreductase